MSEPVVTVLTAVRNGMPYLPETVACIQAQTFGEWEHLIVDDASTDDTAAWVEDAARRDPRIRLLRRTESGGPFVAANEGLEAARGRYIARIDADDLSPPHRLQAQLDFLSSRPELRGCLTPWRSFGRLGIVTGEGLRSMPTRRKTLRWGLLLRAFASHSSWLVEREAYRELGGYRTRRAAQDYEMLLRLAARHWMRVMPEPLSDVRRHDRKLSKERGEEQTANAVEAMRETIREIAGVEWSTAQARALWMAGQSRVWPVLSGLRAVREWERLWAADSSLEWPDRAELRALAAGVRGRFVRANLRRQPWVAAPWLLAQRLRGGRR